MYLIISPENSSRGLRSSNHFTDRVRFVSTCHNAWDTLGSMIPLVWLNRNDQTPAGAERPITDNTVYNAVTIDLA